MVFRLFVLIVFLTGLAVDSADAVGRTDWYLDSRVGMFIHWGLYAFDGHGEWAMFRDGLDPAEYAAKAKKWNPSVGAEERWVECAKSAGMKYIVLTTRHHDGFALWDTKADDYNSMNTPARRDHVRMFADACRRHGIRVGFYYSPTDWRYCDTDPKKMKEMAWIQIRELMSNYGKIDVLWFDFGLWEPKGLTRAEFLESEKLLKMVRGLQPDILINDRAEIKGDFKTIEGRNIPRPPKGAKLWEACITLQDDDWSFWGWCRYTAFRKTPEQIICYLLHCLEVNGNMLLNVGPDANGDIDGWQRDLLAKLGIWVGKNVEAVYGVRGTELATDYPLARGWTGNTCGFFTVKPNTNEAFLYLHAWPGPVCVFPVFKAKINSIELGGAPVAFRQDAKTGRLILTSLPDNPPDSIATVLKVKLGESEGLKEYCVATSCP